ncbi:hypothetical protein [Brumimicrobium mesophilum]|uniref:hypothetical protein n=1 Tax=Brumimicrobium mesophilum TaxID=392717 RepID=UPI000D1432F7|nr:hypothetical protein [Brumimicrobium mesophilum]
METGNILIGVISMMAIIIPFFLMYKKSKNTERGLLKNLKEYTQNNGLQLDKWGSVENIILGIDHINKIAFFSELDGDAYKTMHLNLTDLEMCRVNREGREVKYHGGKDILTHSLEICFYPKNRREGIEIFKLYNEDKNKSLNGEIQLANEWVSIYNDVITSLASTSKMPEESEMAVV